MAEKLKLEDLHSPLLKASKRSDPFHTVGVIGLGIMGQGIAETIATAGIEVIVVEKNEKALKAGLEGLGKSIDMEIKRWSKTAADKRAILSRIKGASDIVQLKGCDIIIEAVDENVELKRQLIEAFYSVSILGDIHTSRLVAMMLNPALQAGPPRARIVTGTLNSRMTAQR